MAPIKFSKYHGTGNDFILIDNRKGDIRLSLDDIALLCHRRYGIGADGLILLIKSEKYDFDMKYFNSDGREGTMCGNGGRCITAFAHDLGIVEENAVFLAIDGKHRAKITKEVGHVLTIEITLNDVTEIHTAGEGIYLLDTGSPHYVKFTNQLDAVDVFGEGKQIRWSKRFQPEGINVNFVQKENTRLRVMTFERGVEDITLSCGTGVTACAVAASAQNADGAYTWHISTAGGNLIVTFTKENGQYTNIRLKGPAVKVFDGIYTR